jgi:transposase
MQVFGLPGHIIRKARAASRLLDAKTADLEAARRRDAVARWRAAMAKGLSAADAAAAVGVPRSTLYRWERSPRPQSRRPKRMRGRAWSPALVTALEHLRNDNPMWGKRKLVVLLRREGSAVSASTVGRILADLVARGVVTPVAILRRRPGGRRFRFTAAERHARRLPKGLKPQRPGELVQIDTLFVNISPSKAIKHFTAYCPVAKWTIGKVATRASAQSAAALLDKLIAEAPFTIQGLQVDGGAEFRADFERACRERSIPLFVLPPKRPQLNGAV